eukprot:6182002-Pleurochrysis_carterae.AAC.2
MGRRETPKLPDVIFQSIEAQGILLCRDCRCCLSQPRFTRLRMTRVGSHANPFGQYLRRRPLCCHRGNGSLVSSTAVSSVIPI